MNDNDEIQMMLEDDLLRRYEKTSDLIFIIESCVEELNKIAKKGAKKLQVKKEYKHNNYIPYYRKQRQQTKTLVSAINELVDLWHIKFDSIFNCFSASGQVARNCPSARKLQTYLEASEEHILIFKRFEVNNPSYSKLELDTDVDVELITKYLAKIIAKLAPSTMLFQLMLYKSTGLLPGR